MKIELLHSSFDPQGRATPEQRLTCFLIDDCVAVDAGSLALAVNDAQRESVRDIIVTHPHMDHIASLPIFIDDLFGTLEEPVCVHATEETISSLERDVFNWTVYPRFSELSNAHGRVMEYVPFSTGKDFQVRHLSVRAVPVSHIVPTIGLIVSDSQTTVAFSSDTAETEDFWKVINERKQIDALIIEASFPNSMARLAEVSKHLTPASLGRELCKLDSRHSRTDILVVHLKPAYRETLVDELRLLSLPNLCAMVPGTVYEWLGQ